MPDNLILQVGRCNPNNGSESWTDSPRNSLMTSIGPSISTQITSTSSTHEWSVVALIGIGGLAIFKTSRSIGQPRRLKRRANVFATFTEIGAGC